MVLEVPDKYSAVPTPTCDHWSNIAPPEGVCRLGFMPHEDHVRCTGIHLSFVLHALLQVDIPDKNFWKVRVGSNDSPIRAPTLEAVDLARVNQYLAHLKLWLLPFG